MKKINGFSIRDKVLHIIPINIEMDDQYFVISYLTRTLNFELSLLYPGMANPSRNSKKKCSLLHIIFQDCIKES